MLQLPLTFNPDERCQLTESKMFNIWGQAGLAHETDRSFSRYAKKNPTYKVQRNLPKSEQKR